MNSKTEFLENISSPEYDYSKCFVFEICRNEKISNQNLTFWNFFFSKFPLCRKTFASESDSFFSEKFHFKLWFSMKKFATKSCLLKWARKMKNLCLSVEQIESKRYFLDVMFWSKSDSSIKIELKIYFSEKFCLHKMIFRKVIYRNPPGRKTLESKTDQFVGKNFTSKYDFFSETSISKSDFQWKGLLQNHAF